MSAFSKTKRRRSLELSNATQLDCGSSFKGKQFNTPRHSFVADVFTEVQDKCVRADTEDFARNRFLGLVRDCSQKDDCSASLLLRRSEEDFNLDSVLRSEPLVSYPSLSCGVEAERVSGENSRDNGVFADFPSASLIRTSNGMAHLSSRASCASRSSELSVELGCSSPIRTPSQCTSDSRPNSTGVTGNPTTSKKLDSSSDFGADFSNKPLGKASKQDDRSLAMRRHEFEWTYIENLRRNGSKLSAEEHVAQLMNSYLSLSGNPRKGSKAVDDLNVPPTTIFTYPPFLLEYEGINKEEYAEYLKSQETALPVAAKRPAPEVDELSSSSTMVAVDFSQSTESAAPVVPQRQTAKSKKIRKVAAAKTQPNAVVKENEIPNKAEMVQLPEPAGDNLNVLTESLSALTCSGSPDGPVTEPPVALELPTTPTKKAEVSPGKKTVTPLKLNLRLKKIVTREEKTTPQKIGACEDNSTPQYGDDFAVATTEVPPTSDLPPESVETSADQSILNKEDTSVAPAQAPTTPNKKLKEKSVVREKSAAQPTVCPDAPIETQPKKTTPSSDSSDETARLALQKLDNAESRESEDEGKKKKRVAHKSKERNSVPKVVKQTETRPEPNSSRNRYVIPKLSATKEQSATREHAVTKEKSVSREKSVPREKSIAVEKSVLREKSLSREKSITRENSVPTEKSVTKERTVLKESPATRERSVSKDSSRRTEKSVHEKDKSQDRSATVASVPTSTLVSTAPSTTLIRLKEPISLSNLEVTQSKSTNAPQDKTTPTLASKKDGKTSKAKEVVARRPSGNKHSAVPSPMHSFDAILSSLDTLQGEKLACKKRGTDQLAREEIRKAAAAKAELNNKNSSAARPQIVPTRLEKAKPISVPVRGSEELARARHERVSSSELPKSSTAGNARTATHSRLPVEQNHSEKNTRNEQRVSMEENRSPNEELSKKPVESADRLEATVPAEAALNKVTPPVIDIDSLFEDDDPFVYDPGAAPLPCSSGAGMNNTSKDAAQSRVEAVSTMEEEDDVDPFDIAVSDATHTPAPEPEPVQIQSVEKEVPAKTGPQYDHHLDAITSLINSIQSKNKTHVVLDTTETAPDQAEGMSMSKRSSIEALHSSDENNLVAVPSTVSPDIPPADKSEKVASIEVDELYDENPFDMPATIDLPVVTTVSKATDFLEDEDPFDMTNTPSPTTSAPALVSQKQSMDCKEDSQKSGSDDDCVVVGHFNNTVSKKTIVPVPMEVKREKVVLVQEVDRNWRPLVPLERVKPHPGCSQMYKLRGEVSEAIKTMWGSIETNKTMLLIPLESSHPIESDDELIDQDEYLCDEEQEKQEVQVEEKSAAVANDGSKRPRLDTVEPAEVEKDPYAQYMEELNKTKQQEVLNRVYNFKDKMTVIANSMGETSLINPSSKQYPVRGLITAERQIRDNQINRLTEEEERNFKADIIPDYKTVALKTKRLKYPFPKYDCLYWPIFQPFDGVDVENNDAVAMADVQNQLTDLSVFTSIDKPKLLCDANPSKWTREFEAASRMSNHQLEDNGRFRNRVGYLRKFNNETKDFARKRDQESQREEAEFYDQYRRELEARGHRGGLADMELEGESDEEGGGSGRRSAGGKRPRTEEQQDCEAGPSSPPPSPGRADYVNKDLNAQVRFHLVDEFSSSETNQMIGKRPHSNLPECWWQVPDSQYVPSNDRRDFLCQYVNNRNQPTYDVMKFPKFYDLRTNYDLFNWQIPVFQSIFLHQRHMLPDESGSVSSMSKKDRRMARQRTNAIKEAVERARSSGGTIGLDELLALTKLQTWEYKYWTLIWDSMCSVFRKYPPISLMMESLRRSVHEAFQELAPTEKRSLCYQSYKFGVDQLRQHRNMMRQRPRY